MTHNSYVPEQIRLMHFLIFRDQESSAFPTLFQEPSKMNSTVETTIKNIQKTDIISEVEQQVPYYITFRKSLENISPHNISFYTNYILNKQFSTDHVLELIKDVFEESIINPKKAAIFAELVNKQQNVSKKHFLTLCTNLIAKLRYDFLLKDKDDDLILQANGLGALIGELFNHDILTWQNIEAHLQRLMAKGYTSRGSTHLIELIFFKCGIKLKKEMPAGCFNSLKSFQSKIVNNCNNFSASKTVCMKEVKENQFTIKNYVDTYADFQRIIIQQYPNYENIIKHLNSGVVNNPILDKYINLIISEAFKKPAMSKIYADILNEMRLIVKKKNVIELKLNELLQNKLTKYLKIAHRNLKSERLQMQLQAQSFSKIISSLHKNDLIQCQTIENFFKILLDENQIKEGCLELVYNIIQSCDTELKITLGTIKINFYIRQLKRNTNPYNMSGSICAKVKSMKNLNNVEAYNQNANVIEDQHSASQSKATTSQHSNKDELLKKLKELQLQ